MISHTESTLNREILYCLQESPPHQKTVSFSTAKQHHIVKVLSVHTTGVCRQHHTWQAAARRLKAGSPPQGVND